MPRKTAEAIREYNQAYYALNRERLLADLHERYHTDDDFFQRHQIASAKWYKERDIRLQRLIRRNISKGIKMDDIKTDPPPAKKLPKKPKSSLQLKRERIAKNLKIIDEKARLFREKLNSQQNIYNAQKIDEDAITTEPRSD